MCVRSLIVDFLISLDLDQAYRFLERTAAITVAVTHRIPTVTAMRSGSLLTRSVMNGGIDDVMKLEVEGKGEEDSLGVSEAAAVGA